MVEAYLVHAPDIDFFLYNQSLLRKQGVTLLAKSFLILLAHSPSLHFVPNLLQMQ